MRRSNQNRNELIISHYADGLTYNQIAEKVGVTRCVVAGVIGRADIQKRGRSRPSAEFIERTNQLIVGGLRRGATQKRIAEVLGLTPSCVSARVKRHGLREMVNA